jgi:D-alanyl-D-alanine endopeptidase (penicillin-binding protein 7)
MNRDVPKVMGKTLNRVVHAIAATLLVAVIAPTTAEAAPRKGTVVKKQHTSISKRVSRTLITAKRRSVVHVATPARLSFGQIAGLHSTQDDLDLKSSVALVIDQMTALVVSEAKLPMDEVITITQDDVDTEKGSSSRLRVGAMLTRGEAMHLSLMSSENRAANALGRTFPGGLPAFVALMNAKAKMLGMKATSFVEPTGLSSRNQSSATDLVKLVNAAYQDSALREFSTSHGYEVAVGNRTLQYKNTNRLVKSPEWEIGLQKTGYISEAGQCLVMQAKVAGRKIIMVFLDSAGKLSRIGDAERVRRWVETNAPTATPASTVIRQVNG